MQETPGCHRIDLQHRRLHRLDLRRDRDQFVGFHCGRFAPRAKIVRQNDWRTGFEILDVRTKFGNDASSLEAGCRR